MEWPAGWDAAKLDLLRGTPINCLLNGPAEAAKAGFDTPTDLSAVQRFDKSPWPGIPEKSWESAGPTGNPWVDANGWQVRLALTKTPGKPVWIASEKPKAMNLALAVADAAHCGGRWVVTLNDELARGFGDSNARAAATWKDATRALAFFEGHRDWATMAPVAKLAIVSSFDDTNSGEVLNLSTRRHLAYHIVEKSQPRISFQGLEAVLYLDDAPPAGPLLAKMVDFARSGGLLMTPRATAVKITGIGPVMETQPRTAVHRLGKGRLAVPLKEWDDPFVLAADTHLLVSHRNDPVRLFNEGVLIPYVTTDGRRTMVQLINYLGRESANFVTLAMPPSGRNPRIRTLDAPDPRPMEVFRESGRQEVHLPGFRYYASIEFEG
jgi:hypothetical protein